MQTHAGGVLSTVKQSYSASLSTLLTAWIFILHSMLEVMFLYKSFFKCVAVFYLTTAEKFHHSVADATSTMSPCFFHCCETPLYTGVRHMLLRYRA